MDKDNGLDNTTASSSGTFPSMRSGSSDDIFYDIESNAFSSSLTPYAEQSSQSLHHVDERTPLKIAFTSSTETKNDKGTKFAILKSTMKTIKPIFLFLCCIACAVIFVWNPENSNPSKLICVSNNLPENLKVGDKYTKLLTVTLVGPFYEDGNKESSNVLTIGLAKSKSGYLISSTVHNFTIDIKSTKEEINATLVTKTIKFDHPEAAMHNDCMVLRLSLDSEEHYPVAFSVTYFSETATENTQIVLAFVILVAVYILIIFELVHRTTAAMFGAFVALSVLSYLNKRPTLEVVLMWVQWETLSLLFGMMILVAVFAKTGFFDYIALKAYKISRGHVWVLITLLCLITGVVSAFLDNVTTILLLTPVTIRLCQVLNLDPTYVLIAEVIFSNIGGTATAIGDPPNILLASHTQIIKGGINFTDFTQHLALGIVFCMIAGYGCLRILYLRVRLENPDPPEIAELKREVEIWRRTAHRVPYSSPEEKTVKLLLIQKTLMLENTIRNMERRQTRKQAFEQKLKELESEYKITDFPLLIKTGFVILLVIALFFLQSFLPKLVFPVGWIAVIGAIALILLADIENIEELMEKVEWTTLVFFAALFVLMEALGFLGLFEYLSSHTVTIIEGVGEKNQLGVAIVAILWISALASSFVDNIPFTAAMIPITLDLHTKNGLLLGPLVWALSMGACLGGNGTLIGASANVVCAGLAEQYGYPISFNKFTKIGFPMMLVTVTVATGYLLICHVVL